MEKVFKEGDILDLAVEKNIVEKSGTCIAYQGKESARGGNRQKDFKKMTPRCLGRWRKQFPCKLCDLPKVEFVE